MSWLEKWLDRHWYELIDAIRGRGAPPSRQGNLESITFTPTECPPDIQARILAGKLVPMCVFFWLPDGDTLEWHPLGSRDGRQGMSQEECALLLKRYGLVTDPQTKQQAT